MAREERPVSPEQVPEEARMYMAALQPHQDHPFVRECFHQVTWLSFVVPGRGSVDFFALEFRIDRKAALIWTDGAGNWGAGRWLPLSHPDADITCPPSPLSLDYFQGAQAGPTVLAAIELLAASKNAEPGIAQKDERKPKVGIWTVLLILLVCHPFLILIGGGISMCVLYERGQKVEDAVGHTILAFMLFAVLEIVLGGIAAAVKEWRSKREGYLDLDCLECGRKFYLWDLSQLRQTGRCPACGQTVSREDFEE